MSAGPFNDLVEDTWTRVQELMASTDGWSPIATIPHNVQDSYLRELPGSSIKIVRATGRAKAPAEAISSLLWSESKEVKQSEDDTLLEHLYVEEFGPDANVIYQLYSLPWPLANREICCVKAIRRTTEGAIYHVNHSVEHVKCPTSSKVVRAQVSHCSYIFTPISDTETDITYIVAFDPMGSIPKWLVNRNTTKVAERVSQVITKGETPK